MVVCGEAPREDSRDRTARRPSLQENLLIVSTVLSVPFIDNESYPDVSSDRIGE